MSMKFALYDYLGRPKGHYTVEEVALAAPVPAKQSSHHIVVLDRSGSMYGDLPAVKTMVEKVLTLEEYRDTDMLVSVVSYSSAGDVTTHVERARVEEVMAPGSKHVEAIRRIEITGLTCISQGLREALRLVRDGELTCVSLHTDGYANDRSPGAEKREIDALVKEFAAKSNVFVNTIGYRGWCDYGLLTSIANACSGTCFKTPTAKELFDTLHATAGTLAGNVTPAFDVPTLKGWYVTFVSNAGDKVLGSEDNLLVRGVKDGDDKRGYRYTRVTPEQYAASPLPVAGKNAEPVLAFAYGQLAEGNVNTAKYALMASRNLTLLNAHARALTNGALSDMATDIRKVLFGHIAEGECDYTSDAAPYELPNARQPSVVGILGLLSRYGARDMQVDAKTLRKGYKRRGVKRIAGTRNPDGTLTPPRAKAVPRNPNGFLAVNGFDLNRNNATVNMTVTTPVTLVRDNGEQVGDTLAGVDLSNLSTFNSYTVVGDGELNLPVLPLRVTNKRLHRELSAVGLVTGDYDPTVTHNLVLEVRPVVAYDASFDPKAVFPVDLFTNLLGAKVLSSILAACMTGASASDTFSEEQVSALKEVHLTPSLYFSPPTTTHYTDLQQALSSGDVDTRVSYKVDFGVPTMLNLGELHSANKYLERMFTLSVNGVEEKKPKFDMRWNAGVTYGYKKLSARTKLTPVDDAMKPYFEEFLGLVPDAPNLTRLLKNAGMSDEQVQGFLLAKQAPTLNDAVAEAFSDTRKVLATYTDNLYEGVSSLVFYVGSTGLLPEEFGASKGMDAEAVKQVFPSLDYCVGKNEADGTFYVFTDAAGETVVLSVYPKSEYFTTEKGLASLAGSSESADE
jgi:Mg-chelatase subunit ChlD